MILFARMANVLALAGQHCPRQLAAAGKTDRPIYRHSNSSDFTDAYMIQKKTKDKTVHR